MKKFYHLKESWYRDAVLSAEETLVDDIMIGDDKGEFRIRWDKFSEFGNLDVFVKIEIYDDAWGIFLNHFNLFEQLAWVIEDEEEIAPENIIDILKKLGYKDTTKRNREDDDED